MTRDSFLNKVLPLVLTGVVCIILIGVIYVEIVLLNKFASAQISTQIRWQDVVVGMLIYLKTSVDFAIFIGNLMSVYPKWWGRVSIEIGTAVGNALGTMLILAIWAFFKDIHILLAIMIALAALVLFKLAEEGLEHTHEGSYHLPDWFYDLSDRFETVLHRINQITGVLLDRIMPNISMRPTAGKTMMGLFVMAFTVPFVLGLDDFAGYVPVFNIVNVFGFAAGVLIGHMILNIFLFISPSKTITIVKNPIISFIGSVAFVILGLWGLFEVVKLLATH